MEKQSSILERVSQVICQCLEKKIENIKEEDRFREDLGFDSVTMVNLQISLEDEFDFLFDPIDDDFEEIFFKVKNVCQYLERTIE